MGRMNQMAPMTKQKPDKATIKRLFSYITTNYKWRFLIVVLCIVISSVTVSIGALSLQILIDHYIKPLMLESNPDFGGMLCTVLLMGGIFLIGIITTWISNYIMVIISQGVLKKIRDDMFEHMQTLPIRYFDTNTHGDIMSHYTNDTDTLRQMLSQSVPQIISSVITVVSVFGMMIYTSPLLTVFVVLTVIGIFLLTGKIAKSSGKYFGAQQKTLGEVNGYIEEMMNGQRVIKVFCHEKKTEDEFDQLNENLFSNMYQANKFANILMPIMANLGHIQYVLIAVVGGALAIGGVEGLTLGGIAAFLQLSQNFTRPISQVGQQMNSIIMALAGAKRIFDLMDEPSETDEGYVTMVHVKEENGLLTECDDKSGIWAWRHPHSDGTLTYTRVEGDVRLNMVDFCYVPEKQVLTDVSVFAEPGQKVAFVGATGAGKTTITNLINRFYDIADGKIRYDGININKIKKADLRHSLGIVLQDTNLFSGTVMENIRYGRLEATDEEVYAAARLANADDFIRRLPKGYQTEIDGDGSELSQGQRQLISIARAAVANPPVMILDEATSSIDTRTESLVQKGMDSLMKGRTVLVIAHRLSTIRNADVIMVLDHGRIIERGNHEQLLKEKGDYYRLYTGAFELE